ncbi:MAG: TonB C-terminal domain-containing protein [Gemmatimonadaceae bacterium]|nr:TonB C-terminal domain-containing protein [Gemmatimonadaceae bacterium]
MTSGAAWPSSTPASLRSGLLLSAAAHAALLVGAVIAARRQPPVMPPVYRVELVGAPRRPAPTPPAEAPAIPTPPAATPAVAPSPKAATRQPALPLAKPARPKPAPPTASAPATKPASPATPPSAPAGTGGTGSEVVSVKTDGIAFPFPGYLQNIVRQIAVRFKPRNPNAPLRADVAFLIHRDGSITNVRFVTRSGSYAFDLEAQGAVEAAGTARAFGPLPAGFADDVLPVTFAFDPRVVR